MKWRNLCFCVSLVHSAKRIIVMMTVFRLWRVEAGGKNQDRQWGRIYYNRQSQWQRNHQWKLRNQIQIFRLRYVTEFQQCWNLLITCFIYDFHFDSFSLTCACVLLRSYIQGEMEYQQCAVYRNCHWGSARERIETGIQHILRSPNWVKIWNIAMLRCPFMHQYESEI